ncbi:MAG: DUF2283 domain-containing protein [Pirellulales bacterium]|nr:DUF2283 domain-containing protein [Pirellulales bacterium]
MHGRYLEITFRRGEPIAAYLYLPRLENEKSCRVQKMGQGMIVDLSEEGRPLGIEILSPQKVSPAMINEILAKYSLPPLGEKEAAPLAAAM